MVGSMEALLVENLVVWSASSWAVSMVVPSVQLWVDDSVVLMV